MVLPELAWSVLPQILGIIIIVVAIWRGSIGSVQNRKSSSSGGNSISCDRPNCVRCRGYANKISDILKKEWHEYIAGVPLSMARNLNRLSLTIENLAEVESSDFKPAFKMADIFTKPFHEPSVFAADVLLLESNYRDILTEFRCTTQSRRGWLVNTTPTGKWKTFYLVNQGRKVEENLDCCPITSRLIKSMQNVMTDCIFGNVCFSVVDAGTHITEHYGPCNVRVRCHLGLDVPPECELIVNGVTQHWERGKCTLFDDSYLHSVTHAGPAGFGTPRSILLVDFWSPELTLLERTALKQLLSSNRLT